MHLKRNGWPHATECGAVKMEFHRGAMRWPAVGLGLSGNGDRISRQGVIHRVGEDGVMGFGTIWTDGRSLKAAERFWM